MPNKKKNVGQTLLGGVIKKASNVIDKKGGELIYDPKVKKFHVDKKKK